jgi:5-methylcytosine-specific restriction endonuclease McrA
MSYNLGPLYPSNWNQIRFARFEKEGYICRLCGVYSKGDLHLHHIRPVTLGGNHSEDNTAPLCSNCHEYVHNKLYKGPLINLRRIK